VLPEPLAFRVFIPPCYSAHPDGGFPVLYLLHGQGFDDGQWERLGAGDAAAELIASGVAPPFLIVLPDEKDTLADPFQSSFGDALVEELIPWVDAHYPTCAERACRAIGGLSRGAAWAVYLGLGHPALFGAIGAHSLPPFIGMEKLVPKEIAAIPPGQTPRIYLDIGWADRYRQPAAGFEDQLNRLGVPHEWYLFEGQHDEAYWSAHVKGYLEWYAAGFR
jgi:enterochelin esterase-like enzyme